MSQRDCIGLGFRETVIISPMNKEKCIMQKEQYTLELRVMKRSDMFREE